MFTTAGNQMVIKRRRSANKKSAKVPRRVCNCFPDLPEGGAFTLFMPL